jgi:RND family efflux transporter MFP subunit
LLKKISIFLSLLIFVVFDIADAREVVVRGTIKSTADVTMMAKVHGTVSRILIKDGEAAKKGDIIMEIENAREKAALALAVSKLGSARASLKEIEVVLENSRKDLKRKEMMKDIIAPKEYENARDQVMQHEAVLATRQADVSQAEAEVKVREAEIEDTYVRAPMDGIVSWIYVKEGETIQAYQTTLCEVTSLNDLYVEVALPINFIRALDKKMSIYINVEKGTMPAKNRFKGEVIYACPTLDASSRTFKARIRIISPSNMVRPGMVADVVFFIP